mgnify:CR=1 FL=1
MDLNELIDRTHFDYEQNETKAKQLEDRILKVPGMSKSYLPKRQYGQQFRGDQLGVTAQSIIVRGDKPLAAFLGLDLSYWQEKNKDQKIQDADLFTKEIFVNGGKMIKRLRPAPQGRAHRIRKRSNHVTIVLDSLNKQNKKDGSKN